MACWLYQMDAKEYSHEQYRVEVWEGSLTQNWSLGDAKSKPKGIKTGDTIILFYSKTNAKEPGIYGWGIVTWTDGYWMHFRPSSPSDYLKMNPLPEEQIKKLIDNIRPFTQGTIFTICDEDLSQIRQKIDVHIHAA